MSIASWQVGSELVTGDQESGLSQLPSSCPAHRVRRADGLICFPDKSLQGCSKGKGKHLQKRSKIFIFAPLFGEGECIFTRPGPTADRLSHCICVMIVGVCFLRARTDKVCLLLIPFSFQRERQSAPRLSPWVASCIPDKSKREGTPPQGQRMTVTHV